MSDPAALGGGPGTHIVKMRRPVNHVREKFSTRPRCPRGGGISWWGAGKGPAAGFTRTGEPIERCGGSRMSKSNEQIGNAAAQAVSEPVSDHQEAAQEIARDIDEAV